MVKNVSEEEILLRKRARRRLIGAITFVILSVVFLPMILDDAPQQEEQQIDIQIPSEELTAEAYPWMTPENAPIAEEVEIPRGTEKPLPFSDSEHAERNENSASDKSRIGAVPTPAKKAIVCETNSNCYIDPGCSGKNIGFPGKSSGQ